MAAIIAGWLLVPTFFGLMLVEALFPARPFERITAWRLRCVFYFALVAVIGAVAPYLLPRWLVNGYKLLPGHVLGPYAGAVVGYLVYTFVQYWFHRLLHRSDIFWRAFHQLHHSPRRVDLAGFTYLHPSEMIAVCVIPLCLFNFALGLDPVAAAIGTYMTALAAMIEHINIRTPQWLGWFFQRPEQHVLHHELGVHAYNYSPLPLWDRAFGTYRPPIDVTPPVGFDTRLAKRLGAMLLMRDVHKETRGGRVVEDHVFQ